ncbi:MAG: anti-sigma factor [Acidobacteriota bacterium]
MSECKKCRDRMIEALYHELGPKDQAVFNRHLESCPGCAGEFEGMASTLKLMSIRKRSDPGEKFWDGYWARLAQRLETEEGLSPAPRQRKRFASFLDLIPRWAYQGAAAALLLAIGILVGRSILSPPAVKLKTSAAAVSGTAPIEPASDPVIRAQNYVERSKVVLLALVNYDPRTEDPYGLDLPSQKKISAELVTQAGALKQELRDPGQRRLRELVTDLEIILIQIANLESEQDLEAVELVKQGVENRGVLLKINLSEMRRPADDKESRPASRTRSRASSA